MFVKVGPQEVVKLNGQTQYCITVFKSVRDVEKRTISRLHEPHDLWQAGKIRTFILNYRTFIRNC